MSRVRSAAQRAPQTKEEALVLAARFATIATEIGAINMLRASGHANVDATADAAAIPLAAEQTEIVKQLKPWFAANLQSLTGGKRKSIELGGCLLGYRISPPKVHYAGGTDDIAVSALVDAKLDADLVRTKLSPDKPAILKLLELVAPAEPLATPDPKLEAQAKLRDLGFSVKQPEQFFVDLANKGDDAQVAGDATTDEVA